MIVHVWSKLQKGETIYARNRAHRSRVGAGLESILHAGIASQAISVQTPKPGPSDPPLLVKGEKYQLLD